MRSNRSVAFIYGAVLITVIVIGLGTFFTRYGDTNKLPDNRCDNYRARFPQTKEEIAQVYGVKENEITLVYDQCESEPAVVRRFVISTPHLTTFVIQIDTIVVITRGGDSEQATIIGPDTEITTRSIEVRFQENINTGGDMNITTGKSD